MCAAFPAASATMEQVSPAAAGVANGLQFAPTTREALELALARLGALWQDRAAWGRMQGNAMAADVGWSRPARQYAALYREIMR